MESSNPERIALGQVFDRTVRMLHGRPDTVHTKATTVRTITKVLELAQTWIVETYREHEIGDTILIEYIGAEGSIRLALPPAVSSCIARQRDSLTTTKRKRAGKAEAARRKAAGILPGFAQKKSKKSPSGS